jgi:ATP-binding cassette subfamily B protein
MHHLPSPETSEHDPILKLTDTQFIQRMLYYAKPYRYYLILAVIAMLLYSLTGIAQPYLLKIAIDRYIAARDIPGLDNVAVIYAAVLCGEFVLFYCQTWLLQLTGQKIIFALRQTVFQHLQNMPVRFFDQNPVGRLVTRATNDTEAIKEMYTDVFVNFCGDAFLLLGIMGMMLYLNWRLALLTFMMLPFIFWVAHLFRSRARQAYRKVRAQLAGINAALQENISGIRVIQAFCVEEKKYRQFEHLNKEHYLAGLQEVQTFALFRPLVDFINTAAIALILWFGGGAVLQSQLEIGTLIAFIQYIEKFFAPVRDLAEKYNILQSALAAAERVFLLLDHKPDITDPQKPVLLKNIQGKIEFKDVWFAYQEPEGILKGVSFLIEPGQKAAIVGPTGAGKSTIINLINRMYEIQKGHILLDGIDIREIRQEELRNLIGVVFQDVFLFTGSIEENIRLGNQNISTAQVIAAAEKVSAAEFITKLPDGYQSHIQQRGSTLSFGQRQLLAFARALAFNRPILLMDEATASIDTETEAHIQAAIASVTSRRTTIIVAHRLSTIQSADQIIVLHKGNITEQGTHEELLRRQGIYYRLYQMQYDCCLFTDGVIFPSFKQR